MAPTPRPPNKTASSTTPMMKSSLTHRLALMASLGKQVPIRKPSGQTPSSSSTLPRLSMTWICKTHQALILSSMRSGTPHSQAQIVRCRTSWLCRRRLPIIATISRYCQMLGPMMNHTLGISSIEMASSLTQGFLTTK